MSAIAGNGIVIAVLLVVVYFCGRSVIRNIRSELRGGGCGGCSGCGGGCSGCSSCSGCTQAKSSRTTAKH